MKLNKKHLSLPGLAFGAASVLMVAAPAFAQEGEQQGGTSYFMAFLKTDNPLGTFLIWVCLLASVAIISMIIQTIMQNRASMYIPPTLVDSLDSLLAEKNYREAMDITADDKSPFGQIMKAALHEAPRGFGAMEVAIDEKADEINNRKVRRLIWLEVAGAAGPMVGLFGTVFGMILSFQQLVSAGGAPKPAALAGGIATALVCTFWGLIVGIPGVIMASILRVRVEGLTAEAIIKAKQLISVFRPGAGKKSTGGSTASAGPATPKPQPA